MQAQQALRLEGQVPTWAAGKMTACLRIVDRLCVQAEGICDPSEAADEVTVAGVCSASRHGANFEARCFRDIEGHYRVVEDAEGGDGEGDLVLAAGRRSGILAWRPGLKAKKMVDCSEQEWCKKLPQRGASHRLQ